MKTLYKVLLGAAFWYTEEKPLLYTELCCCFALVILIIASLFLFPWCMPFRIQSVSSQVSAAALWGVDLPILKKNSKEQVDTEDAIHAKCAVLSRPANISKSFTRTLQYLWLFSNVSSANPDIHSDKYFHIYLTVFIRRHLTIQRCALNAVGDLPLQFCQLRPPHCHWYAEHVLFHSKTELAVWVWQLLSFSCTGGCSFTINLKNK